MTFMKNITLALLSTLTLAGCVSEKREPASLSVGTPMPAFTVSGPDGTVTNADLAGICSVVVFFRTTCPDCSREMPNVEAAFRRVEKSGVRFLTISKETDAATVVPEYRSAAGITMPYCLDPSGAAFTAFDIRYVPTLYLFGSDGKVAYAAVETFEFTVDELVKMIEELK